MSWDSSEKQTGAPGKMTVDEFHEWLEKFTQYSEEIPPMEGETFRGK